jgi:hypothetical protein
VFTHIDALLQLAALLLYTITLILASDIIGL